MRRTRFLKPSSATALLLGLLLGAGTMAAADRLGSSVFPDVPKDSYFDAAVGRLYDAGIIKGDPSGNYRPGDGVSRAEIAVMLDRLRDELNGVVRTDGPSGTASSAPRARSSKATALTSSAAVSSSAASSASQAQMTAAGGFRFTTSTFVAPENTSTTTVTVVRVGGNKGTVMVNYAVTGNTATAGTDFTAVSGTLTFATGETSKTFTVTILDDNASEGNETATVTLSGPTNSAILSSPSTATITIQDNEASSTSSASSGATSSTNPTGKFSFAATAYNINENIASVTITVNREGGSTGAVGVNYATANGTGVSGTEYTSANGTLSFAAGETSKSFSVPVLDDGSIDGSKNFTATLSSPTGGATIDLGTTTVSISDNESMSYGSGSFKFSKAAFDVTESAGYALISVQRVGGSLGTASVNYEASAGTASGQDFTPTNGTLTFLQGESTKVFRVLITKDVESDTEETVNLYISNPVGAALNDSLTSASLKIF